MTMIHARRKNKDGRRNYSFVQAVCDELDASPELELEDLRLGVIRRLRKERSAVVLCSSSTTSFIKMSLKYLQRSSNPVQFRCHLLPPDGAQHTHGEVRLLLP